MKPGGSNNIEALERVGTAFDQMRLWITKAWRIGTLMAKGAYLVSERRRMYQKLGETVYYRILKGELHDPELEPAVHQLDRLTKKIELEEMLIRTQRFGKKDRHSSSPTEEMAHTD